MSSSRDWLDQVPPELRAYAAAEARAHLEEHEATVRFAAVLCRCRRWYDHEDPEPAQAGCYVHTTLVFSPRTGDLL